MAADLGIKEKDRVQIGNDQPTMDLLTQRMEVHEKTAWMLRSLLEK